MVSKKLVFFFNINSIKFNQRLAKKNKEKEVKVLVLEKVKVKKEINLSALRVHRQ
jgi:hypothetical protein